MALRAEQRLAAAGSYAFEGGAALMADEHLEFDIRLDRTRRAQGRNGGRRGIRRQCRP